MKQITTSESWWDELLLRLIYGQFPLLPWPELPQDQAMVAFFIDRLCDQLDAATALAAFAAHAPGCPGNGQCVCGFDEAQDAFLDARK